jgi:mRNA interferase MazF
MTIRPGEFWVAEIQFTGGGGSKKRPVLVLWLDGQDAVAAAVTTANPRSNFDVELTEWKSSGLKRSSTVRLSRLDCLEQSLLIARIGNVARSDAERIVDVWNDFIKPQF